MTILYVGWLGHSNIGDECCFYAIRQLLPKSVELTPWDYPDKPFTNNPDLIIYGGGTILHLEYWVREAMIQPLVDLGVPLIIWGPGVWSPSKHKMSSKTLRLLNQAKAVGVRGPRSLQALQDGRFESATVIGDPSLTLSTNKTDIGKDSKHIIKNSKHIAINIGFTGGKINGSDSHVISETESIIDALSKRGYEVILFGLMPEDMKVINALNPNKKFMVKPFNIDWANLVNFFKTCRCVISEKLHGCVLSTVANTPFISMAYLEKCHDFAESIDLGSYAIRVDSKALAKKVMAKFDSLDDDRSMIISHMKFYQKLFFLKHQKLAKFVSSMFL